MKTPWRTGLFCLLAAGVAGNALLRAADNAGKAPSAADQTMAAADGLLLRGQYVMAGQEYAAFLKNFPNDPAASIARFHLALCQYQAGDAAGAQGLLVAAANDKTLPQRDEALAMLTQVQLALGQYGQAITAADELLAVFPKSGQVDGAAVNRAQAYYRLNRFDDSLSACQQFLKARPGSGQAAAATYLQALCQQSLRRYDDAIATANGLLQHFPNSPYPFDAKLLIAQALEAQGKLDDAAKEYQTIASEGGANQKAAAHFGLGMVLQRAGQWREAIDQFTAVLTQFSQTSYAPAARLQLGVTQLAAGDTATARKAFAAISSDDPAHANAANYWLARCDMAEKKFTQAKDALDALAKITPPPAEMPQILFDRGQCLLALEQYKEAAAQFAQVVGAFPQDPQTSDARYHQALALYHLSDFKGSQALCEQSLAGAPAGVGRELAGLLAESLFARGQYEKAGEYFAALVKDAPADDQHKLALRRGQCAYFSGNYAAAIPILQPLANDPQTAKDPLLQDALFLFGDSLLQTSNGATAAKVFGYYLTVSAQRPEEARYKLAVAELRCNDEKSAVENFSQVTKAVTPTAWTARAYLQLAQIAYKNKEADVAGDALNKATAAVKDPPEDVAAPALFTQAQIDFDARHYADAATRFNQVVSVFPNNPLAADALFNAGQSLQQGNQQQAALDAFNAYLKRYPAGKFAADARHLGAVALTRLGHADAASGQLAALAGDKKTRTSAVLYDLAWAQRTTKDFPSAAGTYQELISDFSSTPLGTMARVELPDVLYIQGHFAEAQALLEKFLNEKPADAHVAALAQYRLAYCYVKLNDPGKALPLFDAFAAGNGTDALASNALYQAGEACIAIAHAPGNTDQLSAAADRFAAVLKSYPDSAAAILAALKLGEVQNEQQKYEDAAGTFTQFLQAHGDDQRAYLAHFGLGWSLENRDQMDQARAQYAMVIKATNTVTAARAQFQTGETYFAQKQFDLAAKELLKVDILYAYPEWSGNALLEAGRAFEELHQKEQAVVQYKTVLQKFPQSNAAALAQKRLAALAPG